MKKTIIISLTVSALVLFEAAFGLSIGTALPVIFGSIFFMVYSVFFVVLIKNIIGFLKKSTDSFRGLVINLIAITFVVIMYSIDFERNMNLRINREARQEVIQLIAKGELKGEGTIKLPDKYKKLSQEGQIEVNEMEKPYL